MTSVTMTVVPPHLRPYLATAAGCRLSCASEYLFGVWLFVWPLPNVDDPADPEKVARTEWARAEWRKYDGAIDALTLPAPGEAVALDSELTQELICSAISQLREGSIAKVDAPTDVFVENAHALRDLVALVWDSPIADPGDPADLLREGDSA
jgi:hypothetical protein